MQPIFILPFYKWFTRPAFVVYVTHVFYGQPVRFKDQLLHHHGGLENASQRIQKENALDPWSVNELGDRQALSDEGAVLLGKRSLQIHSRRLAIFEVLSEL